MYYTSKSRRPLPKTPTSQIPPHSPEPSSPPPPAPKQDQTGNKQHPASASAAQDKNWKSSHRMIEKEDNVVPWNAVMPLESEWPHSCPNDTRSWLDHYELSRGKQAMPRRRHHKSRKKHRQSKPYLVYKTVDRREDVNWHGHWKSSSDHRLPQSSPPTVADAGNSAPGRTSRTVAREEWSAKINPSDRTSQSHCGSWAWMRITSPREGHPQSCTSQPCYDYPNPKPSTKTANTVPVQRCSSKPASGLVGTDCDDYTVLDMEESSASSFDEGSTGDATNAPKPAMDQSGCPVSDVPTKDDQQTPKGTGQKGKLESGCLEIDGIEQLPRTKPCQVILDNYLVNGAAITTNHSAEDERQNLSGTTTAKQGVSPPKSMPSSQRAVGPTRRNSRTTASHELQETAEVSSKGEGVACAGNLSKTEPKNDERDGHIPLVTTFRLIGNWYTALQKELQTVPKVGECQDQECPADSSDAQPSRLEPRSPAFQMATDETVVIEEFGAEIECEHSDNDTIMVAREQQDDANEEEEEEEEGEIRDDDEGQESRKSPGTREATGTKTMPASCPELFRLMSQDKVTVSDQSRPAAVGLDGTSGSSLLSLTRTSMNCRASGHEDDSTLEEGEIRDDDSNQGNGASSKAVDDEETGLEGLSGDYQKAELIPSEQLKPQASKLWDPSEEVVALDLDDSSDSNDGFVINEDLPKVEDMDSVATEDETGPEVWRGSSEQEQMMPEDDFGTNDSCLSEPSSQNGSDISKVDAVTTVDSAGPKADEAERDVCSDHLMPEGFGPNESGLSDARPSSGPSSPEVEPVENLPEQLVSQHEFRQEHLLQVTDVPPKDDITPEFQKSCEELPPILPEDSTRAGNSTEETLPESAASTKPLNEAVPQDAQETCNFPEDAGTLEMSRTLDVDAMVLPVQPGSCSAPEPEHHEKCSHFEASDSELPELCSTSEDSGLDINKCRDQPDPGTAADIPTVESAYPKKPTMVHPWYVEMDIACKRKCTSFKSKNNSWKKRVLCKIAWQRRDAEEDPPQDVGQALLPEKCKGIEDGEDTETQCRTRSKKLNGGNGPLSKDEDSGRNTPQAVTLRSSTRSAQRRGESSLIEVKFDNPVPIEYKKRSQAWKRKHEEEVLQKKQLLQENARVDSDGDLKPDSGKANATTSVLESPNGGRQEGMSMDMEDSDHIQSTNSSEPMTIEVVQDPEPCGRSTVEGLPEVDGNRQPTEDAGSNADNCCPVDAKTTVATEPLVELMQEQTKLPEPEVKQPAVRKTGEHDSEEDDIRVLKICHSKQKPISESPEVSVHSLNLSRVDLSSRLPPFKQSQQIPFHPAPARTRNEMCVPALTPNCLQPSVIWPTSPARASPASAYPHNHVASDPRIGVAVVSSSESRTIIPLPLHAQRHSMSSTAEHALPASKPERAYMPSHNSQNAGIPSTAKKEPALNSTANPHSTQHVKAMRLLAGLPPKLRPLCPKVGPALQNGPTEKQPIWVPAMMKAPNQPLIKSAPLEWCKDMEFALLSSPGQPEPLPVIHPQAMPARLKVKPERPIPVQNPHRGPLESADGPTWVQAAKPALESGTLKRRSAFDPVYADKQQCKKMLTNAAPDNTILKPEAPACGPSDVRLTMLKKEAMDARILRHLLKKKTLMAQQQEQLLQSSERPPLNSSMTDEKRGLQPMPSQTTAAEPSAPNESPARHHSVVHYSPSRAARDMVVRWTSTSEYGKYFDLHRISPVSTKHPDRFQAPAGQADSELRNRLIDSASGISIRQGNPWCTAELSHGSACTRQLTRSQDPPPPIQNQTANRHPPPFRSSGPDNHQAKASFPEPTFSAPIKDEPVPDLRHQLHLWRLRKVHEMKRADGQDFVPNAHEYRPVTCVTQPIPVRPNAERHISNASVVVPTCDQAADKRLLLSQAIQDSRMAQKHQDYAQHLAMLQQQQTHPAKHDSLLKQLCESTPEWFHQYGIARMQHSHPQMVSFPAKPTQPIHIPETYERPVPKPESSPEEMLQQLANSHGTGMCQSMVQLHPARPVPYPQLLPPPSQNLNDGYGARLHGLHCAAGNTIAPPPLPSLKKSLPTLRPFAETRFPPRDHFEMRPSTVIDALEARRKVPARTHPGRVPDSLVYVSKPGLPEETKVKESKVVLWNPFHSTS